MTRRSVRIVAATLVILLAVGSLLAILQALL
jgi:hypothetical protein